jgi:serine/threonine-protein kinase
MSAAAPTTPVSATTPLPHLESPGRRGSMRDGGEARFLPGAVLHGRYRIVGLLGRGGMGEVYRADDLKIGQAVALKFLPETLARDAEALNRFYAEVRIGRQVSHPNVCRLYDLIEIDGHHCLTMEYVDGEDLATLLKRIGRLPADKAVEFARDLTAGLAAAHDNGVIHRDLKPANIMIDGQGRARITDFGIAAIAEEAERAGFAGTLVYMAPEQLDGAPPSVRTDLYALGLVLYETFTGKRLFDAPSPGELKALHARTEPPSLSSTVHDVPPAVEQIVRACLARDPNVRPTSARAVLAALPGGDPLAAAIAAGETPTPAMVAAAGKVGDLSRTAAWSLLLAAFAGLILIAALAGPTTMIGRLHPELSPDRLSEKAEQVLTMFGYPSPPADHAAKFVFDNAYLDERVRHGNTPKTWEGIEKVQPGPLLFVYRGGTQALVSQRSSQLIFTPSEIGRIDTDDPPMTQLGMTRVVLDRRGRLFEFVAVPLPRSDTEPTRGYDWSAALAATGLDIAHLQLGKSMRSAPVDNDFRQAWNGTYPDQPDAPFHVEAAAWHGKPVWFAVLYPWDRPQSPVLPASLRIALWVVLIFGMGCFGAILAIARRNLRLGRGDRKGAVRLGIAIALSLLIALLLRADHAAAIDSEISLFTNIVAQAVFFGWIAWLDYLGLEPYARRRWPQLMISWTRLLDGRLRDPMVGRDVLLGVLGGIAMMVITSLAVALPSGFGHVQQTPLSQYTTPLTSDRHIVFFFLVNLYTGFAMGLGGLMGLFMFRGLFRVNWLVHAVTFLFIDLAMVAPNPTMAAWSPEVLLMTAIWYVLLMRVGALAAGVACYFIATLSVIPVTLDMHSWYADRTLIAFGLTGALLLYAFWISLGGKSPFGTAFLDDHDG